jgi:hypothetical protein
MVLDPEGDVLMGLRYPPRAVGFEALSLPSGTPTSDVFDTSGLVTDDPVIQLENVQW